MAANPIVNGTRTCFRVWVNLDVQSLNTEKHQHWTVTHRNKKEAVTAWFAALSRLSVTERNDLMEIITKGGRVRPYVMPLRSVLELTTETPASSGNTHR